MRSSLSLLLLLLVPSRGEDGKEEEGMKTDETGAVVYPSVFIATLVRNKAHALPYFFGHLEELDYPKDRISLYIPTDHNSDDSVQVLRTWADAARDYYASIDVVDTSKWATGAAEYLDEQGPWDWVESRYEQVMRLREAALLTARESRAHFLWLLDADQFVLHPRTLQSLMRERKTMIAPMMRALHSNYSNFWGAVNEEGYYQRSYNYIPILNRQLTGVYQVPMIHSNVLIDLRDPKSELLSFLPPLIAEGPLDDIMQLSRSAKSAGLQMFVSNRERFGLLLEPSPAQAGLEYEVEEMRYVVLELMQEGPVGLLHSPFLTPFPGAPSTLGFDKIYLINLLRRPKRRKRMKAAAAVLNLDLTYWPATDGAAMEFEDLAGMGMAAMPEFKDPHGKRPLTLGEIGCLLSHYRIWEEVVESDLDKVLILEDDLRFVKFFRQYVDVIFQDTENTKLDWDLIYLGRKRLEPDKEGVEVEGNQYLTSVSYSYWTLAYALTRRGAEKLLDARPLRALLPVDEFLPIMFNRHPEAAWAAYFPNRNLRALTTEPLLVHPTHYTGEPGHFSDTETAPLIPPHLIPSKDEL